MRFEKWQALGNDYMIVEQAELPFELTPARIRKLCAGHFGVFADGVLLLTPSEDPRLVAQLRIYNPDGTEAELSGNGAREAILYLRRHGWTDQDVFSIQTAAGEIRPTITGPDTCRVDMGHASLASKDFPSGPGDGRGELLADERAWSFQHVSIGNPQCAIHVEDLVTLQALDLPTHRTCDRSPRAVPQPHERVLVYRGRATCGRRRCDPRAHFRAWGRGDALLRHGCYRSRGGQPSARGAR